MLDTLLLALALAGAGIADSTSAVARAWSPPDRPAARGESGEAPRPERRERPEQHQPVAVTPDLAVQRDSASSSAARPDVFGTVLSRSLGRHEAALAVISRPVTARSVTSTGATTSLTASGPVMQEQATSTDAAGSSQAAKQGSQLTVAGSMDNQAPTSAWSGHEGLYFYTVTIPGGTAGTATGYQEKFMVFAPSQVKPRPMLVVFHKFGTTQQDAWANTQFFQEAWNRGWHIVAPLSASGVNFGAPITQVNTEVVLDWMTANFNVRPDRIYGVGFSMGGGGALSYAARHLDPTKPMFAGIVDHTGGIALNDTYINEPSSQFIFDFWFGNGAPGSASAWSMAASSMLDFHPGTLVVDTDTDMARNLQNMPVKIVRVVDEPLAYLTVQSQVLETHLVNQGTQTKVEVVPGDTHEWSTLSAKKTVNWLSLKRLTLPLSGRILADRSATFYYFAVEQIALEVFSAFDFDLDLAGNTLTVTETANLTSLEVETLEAGLDPLSVLRVDMDTSDGVAVEYVLRDWTTAPSAVTRDALATVAFVHDPLAETLTLQETDGSNHLWEITP